MDTAGRHPLLRGRFGYAPAWRRRDPAAALKADKALDAALIEAGYPEAFASLARPGPVREILAVVVTDPPHEAETRALIGTLRRSRHRIRAVMDSRPDVPKFAKVNEAVRSDGAPFDWLMIVDDDVVIGEHFVDRFVAAAEAAELVLAQPAHRIHSYASYAVTQRKPRSLVRATHFVEIGQIVALHRSILPELMPFPETRWGWGVDFLWADKARALGWRIGVVDAVPFEHLRPIGSLYSTGQAMAEASVLLFEHGPAISRQEMLSGDRVLIGW